MREVGEGRYIWRERGSWKGGVEEVLIGNEGKKEG